MTCHRPRFPVLLVIGMLAIHSTKAQQTHVLFSAIPQGNEASEASLILAQAETRMRFVQLEPTTADGRIDLSRPLALDLVEDVHYTVQLKRKAGPALPGLEVWTGRVSDSRFDHLPRYRNAVFVLNTRTGRLVATVETDRGFFQVLPTESAGRYRIRQTVPFDNGRCGTVSTMAARPGVGASRSDCLGDCDETDADGRYVVDVFAGFSDDAAAIVGDMEAFAQSQMESVNLGLTHSAVDDVYLRLVGVGTTANNPGVVTNVLDDAWDWFADGVEAAAPDLLVTYQTPTDDPGSAGGWGEMPGRSAVVGVQWPTAYRHEVGHNVGGGHCYPDFDGYQNGYDNGHWRTHLCGNDVNLFSNPWLSDDQGNPIGNADQADMVRTWHEQAAGMANHGAHRVPYDEQDECAGLICLPMHWGDPIEYIKYVRFDTLVNEQEDPAWNCSDVVGYSDYRYLSIEVLPSASYELYVASTVSWEESTLRAWVDWNNDHLFSTSEMVMDESGIGPWSTMVTVPWDAPEGEVRLRIRQQFGLDQVVSACNMSNYSSGETEDYTLVILPALNAGVPEEVATTGMMLRPNPATSLVAITANGLPVGPVHITFINTIGQRVANHLLQVSQAGDGLIVDVTELPGGLYACEMRDARCRVRSARLVKE